MIEVMMTSHSSRGAQLAYFMFSLTPFVERPGAPDPDHLPLARRAAEGWSLPSTSRSLDLILGIGEDLRVSSRDCIHPPINAPARIKTILAPT